ncbi:MAG: 2-C-methyl-D-erythritol 4-phosphate cytidylyltransferase [Clostridia bacterium]|nr:2-C-methyl-D-erythritol 4-phosphate cytidylyltransferase [Clostridia bacterium]
MKRQTADFPYTTALIVAAGRSARMGADKMWMELGGEPVILRTLRAFEQAQTVREIIVVTRPESIAALHAACDRVSKLTQIVAGGATRQQSVYAGVQAAPVRTAFFSIHDGARPLVTPQQIDEVNRCAYRTGAAALAVPVKDTIKLTDADGIVQTTPDRSRLWQVQTPQVFDAVQYKQALQSALLHGQEYTDDCQLMEQAGRPVQLCPGDYGNIKITTPEDIWMAQAILKGRDV